MQLPGQLKSNADADLWHVEAASTHMLCMVTWHADTRQLGEWRTHELEGFVAGRIVDEYTVSWAPCCSKLAVTAHCCCTHWLRVWIVSSCGQVLQHMDLPHATRQPRLVWTRDSTAVLLSLEQRRPFLCALTASPRRTVLPPAQWAATLHAAPYLKGSECMVLLGLPKSAKLVSCSGGSPRQVDSHVFESEVAGVACGLTHVAVHLWQRQWNLPYLHLFVLAAGPHLVFTNEIQLSVPICSVPDEYHEVPCWAFSPDDSHVAIVQQVGVQVSPTSWTVQARLSILNTRDAHSKQQFLLPEQQLGEHASPAYPHKVMWSGCGSHISVSGWPEGRHGPLRCSVIQLSRHES